MINVRYYGKEPFQVAVIHGGPGAPGSVAAIARELSKNYGVLEPIQTKTSLEGQVLELYGVLKAFGDLPITLIGHSWGAWLAYIITARYPSLTNKLILVGSGPFEEKYVKSLKEKRFSRLNSKENKDFQFITDELNSPETEEQEKKIIRLGELVSKTDNFKTIEIETEEHDRILAEGNTFQLVWNEASKLRKTGSLLEFGKQIKCPVVAIHGDYDPHPAEGIHTPLKNVIKDFRFYLIKKCGHSPWKEQYANKRFYKIIREEIDSIRYTAKL
ncbi:MAG: alpha/beta hydrolase [ANME-2 cluster archaeon]|nr:alpha/beta hydrolase [ANME-2 cluster archaeon]MBC2700956.1 alpha/beta hydrolase [ANME-2 cluster archaeon]MBC2709092.1 alpha/beta hydrolase [ANME-2 cluster archaeon]MBC2747433.1 alpha/beta hydrolase [ANME-2 cluster archaeon]